MHNFRHILAAALVLLSLFALPARAQDDDKGFLTRAIQDALSGAGRAVSIDGFRGALSSAASFDRMTISDGDGVWLTLENVVLDWNRSALLRGRLEVERLTAERLDIPRLPVTPEDELDLPEAEAQPFSLPELPVSVEIADFSVDEINLGAPLLGEEAQLAVKASASLNDEEGVVDFTAERTDAKRGQFAIRANLERSDNVLDLLLSLSEEPEGIAARLMNLPGQPSVEMRVEGSGPLDDFATDVNISTDGEERLAGQITLGSEAGEGPGLDRRVRADIGGDITALLAPRYREFFGTEVRLTTDATLAATGAVDVSSFALEAQAANLEGRVQLNTDKWPTLIDISGTVANPDGTAILLPVGGESATSVERVELRVDYDADAGDALDAAFDITALDTAGVKIASTTLSLDGTLRAGAEAAREFLGDVVFEADGLELTDAASAEAIGSRITGSANINYVEGEPVRITGLDLTGTDYGLAGDLEINGFDQNFLTTLDARLEAADLSRFSALAGRELDGATALALEGSVTPLGGMFDLTATGTTDDIRIGIPQADAVLAGRTELTMKAERSEEGTFLRDVVLENEALSFEGQASLRTDNSEVEARARLNDVSQVLPQYEGPITVTGTATQDARGWSVDVATDGPYGAALTVDGLVTGPNAMIAFTADVPRIEDFVPDTPATGPLRAEGTLARDGEAWVIVTDASGPFDATASVEGQVLPALDIGFDVSLPQVSVLAPQVSGPLSATGRLRQTEEGFFEIDTTATGPYNVRAAVQGALTPMVDITFDASLPDVNPLVPQLNGPATAKGALRQTETGFYVDADATGPYGSRATVNGMATGPEMQLAFDVAVPNVNPLAPGISGPLSARGTVRQTEEGIVVDTNASGPYSSTASVQGLVTGPNANVDFNLAVPNIGALVDNISGPLDVTGNARREGEGFRIDTNANGPSGTRATVAGLVNGDGTLNLDIAGNAPLGLANPFLEPRDLQGQASFDLTVNGPPALSSVSGTITANNATLTAPELRVALTDVDATVRLGGNRADLQVSAISSEGGRIQIGGGITLTPSLPADIQIGVQDLVLIDPRLYRTSLSGSLRLAGPLTGGATISGQINVGDTEVQVPSTGLTSIGDIPPITHIGERPGVDATRAKAGLNGENNGDDPSDDVTGPGFGLNVQINAPNRIFVRGRGLDAELGGDLLLTGSTNRIISAGRFELIRGRLDILGKRFDLVEGAITFEGDLIPYLRFVTRTDTRQGTVSVVVEGPANEPEVRFESSPDAPQDEVLAQLLFGRNIADISAFQALQLASAVATLAGRGGGGIISNLREGFGLDDFDVTTTDDGETALRLGKYLSENVYTDVTAASDGSAEVSLNLDITKNLKGKATLGSDGDSRLGIFFEKDY
jgi:translocation and assembly module TamB